MDQRQKNIGATHATEGRTTDRDDTSERFEVADTTLNAVRLMMEAEARRPSCVEKGSAEPEPEIENAVAKPKLTARMLSKARAETRSKSDDVFPALDPVEAATGHPDAASEEVPATPVMTHGIAKKIRAYRPSGKVTVLLAIAAVAVWRPWLIPGLVFLAIWIALIVYLTVGPDRLAEILGPLRARFEARYPERVAEIRRRAQMGADRMELWVEKLPARWRDGIHVPDMGRSQTMQSDLEERPDPFERLAAERERDSAQDLGRA